MKAMTTNYRFWALTALAGIAAICLLGEPTAQEPWAWFCTLVASKGIGLATATLAVHLYRRWAKQGKIECLTNLIKEED